MNYFYEAEYKLLIESTIQQEARVMPPVTVCFHFSFIKLVNTEQIGLETSN